MSDERIFEATPQRLARARREGNVARCASVVTVASLACGCLLLFWYGQHVFERLGWQLREQLSSIGSLRLGRNEFVELSGRTSLQIGKLVLPVFACGFVVAVLANVAQGGMIWAPGRVVPDPTRLSPGTRLRTMLSIDRVIDAIIEFAKMVVCLVVAGGVLWSQREQLAVGREGLYASFASAAGCIFRVLFSALAALGCLSLGEYALATLRHRKSLRMTAEEWQAEMKDRETTMSVKQMRRFAGENDAGDK